MLNVDDISARYGRVPALNGVSLQVNPGELLAIVGPNGAGKTTLAKCIAGFVTPTHGTISLDGQRISNQRPDKLVRNGVRLVLEGHRVFPELTVHENLRLGRLALSDAAQFPQRLEDVLDLFPILRERLRQPARELSGGQQQLLALAQAFIGEPQLLMCDEPSLGVAQRLIPEILTALRRMAERGTRVIVIEQVLTPPLSIADQVIVLNRGTVIARGTPGDFPRERLQELFLGTTSDG
ncbi:ABC transporter ATP-binding protein [Leekyejoonella antrihumi]|uniref:ATP-binding cassette domain-containing protein n=1 Tax=Leekyejoonella antrihumi TaxID=1660198 RepID=A0A563DTE3_9MICO|nr:ATP-binding cassette domain-containing protein [Leekyejoonella antrihumi]TWP33253.1 ATP-binding cassette domain-containing protein [Leekyejoonella antrihumi]